MRIHLFLLSLTLTLQSEEIPAFAQTLARSRTSAASRLEQQQTWVARGNDLMKKSAFVEAYSAFLLAKSLGAAGMSDRMKTAQDQNLAEIRKSGNRLLFQAGLQTARAMAEENLTQSLRLLHFVDTHAQTPADRAAVLRTLSEVTTNSDQWVYADRMELDPTQHLPPPLASTPDGRWFVFNQTLWQKQGSTYRKGYTFSPTGGVVQAVFSPNGNFLIFCQPQARADTLLRLDSVSVKTRIALTPKTAERQYQFTPDGTHLVATSPDQKPDLWRLSSETPPRHLVLPGNLTEPVFSPNGRFLMAWFEVSRRDQWVDGGFRQVIERGDAVLGRLTETGLVALDTLRQVNDWWFGGPGGLVSVSNERVQRWSLSDEGLRLDDERHQPGAAYEWVQGNAGVFVLRDNAPNSRQPYRFFTLGDSLKLNEVATPDSIEEEFSRTSLEISDDGHSLLSYEANRENGATVWRIEAGALRKCHRFATSLAEQGHHFSPNGRLLIVNYTGATSDSLWRVNDRDLTGLHAFQGELSAETASSVWFSPDGEYLATHFQNQFQDVFWRVSERGLQAITTFEDDIEAVKFLPGQSLAGLRFFRPGRVGMPDVGQAYDVLFDLGFQQSTLTPTYHFPQACSLVRFSPDGRYLFAQVTGSKPQLTLFRMDEWFLTPLETIDQTASEAVISPNGRYVLLRGEASGTETSLWHCDERLHLTRLDALPGRFRGALFSPDSRFLLLDFPNSANTLVSLTDSLPRVVHTFQHRFARNGYRFSPDGRWLVIDFTGTSSDSLWRVSDRGLVPAMRFNLQLRGPSVAFSPDSRYLLTSFSQDETLYLWQLEKKSDPEEVKRVEGLETINTLSLVKNAGSDSLTFLFSYFDVNLATTYPEGDGLLPKIKRLGHGQVISPVYEIGSTLFFLSYSDLTRRKTLLGYDLSLREITVRRDVSNCLDVLISADGTVRIALPEGIQSMQAPRNVMQRIAGGGVAPIAPDLVNRFSPR